MIHPDGRLEWKLFDKVWAIPELCRIRKFPHRFTFLSARVMRNTVWCALRRADARTSSLNYLTKAIKDDFQLRLFHEWEPLSLKRLILQFTQYYSDASPFPLWLCSRDTPFLVIHDGSVPPIFIFLDSLRDFYFRVIVTSIFLLEFAAKVLAPWAHPLKPAYPYAAWPSDWSPVGLPSGLSGWVGVPFVQVPVHGWRRYRSLHWVSSVSVQVYCELLARVPVTTTPAPLFEYLTPRGKAL